MAQKRLTLIGILKFVLAILSAFRLTLHIVVLVLSSKRELLWKDLDRYGENYGNGIPQTKLERIILFVRIMTFVPEYRNVFYFRQRALGHLLGLFCRPMESLKMNAKRCGPGLFIHHGFGTLVSAEEIGAHCSIGQLVSVGYVNNSVDRPRIGNNVTIGAGARILGAVTVGDNAFISANSLVIADVPAGATVIGVPSRVIAVRPSNNTNGIVS